MLFTEKSWSGVSEHKCHTRSKMMLQCHFEGIDKAIYEKKSL